MLIQLGARVVNHRDDSMKTPLHDAVAMEKVAVEVVDLLLSNGANVNAEDYNGDTPLHLAVSKNNDAVVRRLLQNGASASSKNKYQQTPLHRLRWATDGAVEIANLLMANGVDVNAIKNDTNGPLLHTAVANNDLTIARLLIESGASTNCKDDFPLTPLHCVRWSTKKAVDMVALLLANGADVNAEDQVGETALHLAVADNNVSIVRMLLEHGASTGCRDPCRRTPLHRVHWATEEAPKMVDSLITRGADVNAGNYKNETALHEAASVDDTPVVQMLIDRGATVSCKDKLGRTPLQRALLKETSVETVQLLLTGGADVNARDDEGSRPLHYVAKVRKWYPGCKRVLQMLCERGAVVKARNNQGKSALINALTFGNLGLIFELIKYDADVNDLRVYELMCRGDLVILRRHHRLKLKAANLLYRGERRSYAIDVADQGIHKECLIEVEKLKNTFIDDYKSLYDFLQMQPKRRCFYVKRKILKQLIDSSTLEELFPHYSVVIMRKYHGAVTRKLLLGPAREALQRLIRFPDVVDQVLDYLADEDWLNIIEAGAD